MSTRTKEKMIETACYRSPIFGDKKMKKKNSFLWRQKMKATVLNIDSMSWQGGGEELRENDSMPSWRIEERKKSGKATELNCSRWLVGWPWSIEDRLTRASKRASLTTNEQLHTWAWACVVPDSTFHFISHSLRRQSDNRLQHGFKSYITHVS